MPAMIGEVARVGGLVALVDFEIGVVERLELRDRLEAERAELVMLGIIVKDHRRRRSGLRAGARAVGGLALGKDATRTEGRRIEIFRVAPGFFPSLSHS